MYACVYFYFCFVQRLITSDKKIVHGNENASIATRKHGRLIHNINQALIEMNDNELQQFYQSIAHNDEIEASNNIIEANDNKAEDKINEKKSGLHEVLLI